MTEPRHFVLPREIVSTGWPAVEKVCREFGIVFDPWQQQLNRAVLGKRSDGLYAADTVVMSIPRQVGKTFNVAGLVFADSIINPGTTTVWTAHRFAVSRETFDSLRAIARLPKLAPHIDEDEIKTGAGNESIPFRNGSRIVFKARERGAVRGFTKVRRLVLDEAQILTGSAMSDLAPTTNAAHNPQVILMGTPPKETDPSEAFSGLREDSLKGDADSQLYIEYSADPDGDLNSWGAVAQANPSFPHRTDKRAINRLRRLLESEDDYAREVLGIWGETSSKQVIGADSWAVIADPASMAVDRLTLGIDVAPDRSVASVALAGARADGVWHVELDEQRSGASWVVPWVADRVASNDIRAVVLDSGSAAESLVGDLVEAGVTPTVSRARDMAGACGLLYDSVLRGQVRHTDQPQMNLALSMARKRPLGDAWAWNRKSAGADITPLVAATLALWGAKQPKKLSKQRLRRPGRGSRQVRRGRRATVL